jgi:prevent-host-death family protein
LTESLSLDKLSVMKSVTKEKKNIIGLKDLRENMEVYIERVRSGESLTVVRRSEPVFQISPAGEDVREEDGWDTVLDLTKVRKGGVPLNEVIAAIQKTLAE